MDTPQAKIKSQRTARMMRQARRSIVPSAVVPRGHWPWAKSCSQAFLSPFKDCVDNFGNFDGPRYLRPMDDQVNGYIKFNWPRIGERKVDHQATNSTDEDIKTESYGGNGEETHRRKSSVASTHTLSNYSSCPSAGLSSTRVSGLVSGNPRSAMSPITPHSSSRIHVPTPNTRMICFNGGLTAAPRKLPPHFGHHVAMDHIDRKFWTFCKPDLAAASHDSINISNRYPKLVSRQMHSEGHKSLAYRICPNAR